MVVALRTPREMVPKDVFCCRTEEVDVGVVDRKVNKQDPGPLGDPAPSLELLEDLLGGAGVPGEQLVVPTARVSRDDAVIPVIERQCDYKR